MTTDLQLAEKLYTEQVLNATPSTAAVEKGATVEKVAWNETSDEVKAAWTSTAKFHRSHGLVEGDTGDEAEGEAGEQKGAKPLAEEVWLPTKEEYLAAGKAEGMWEAFRGARAEEYQAKEEPAGEGSGSTTGESSDGGETISIDKHEDA